MKKAYILTLNKGVKIKRANDENTVTFDSLVYPEKIEEGVTNVFEEFIGINKEGKEKKYRISEGWYEES